MPKPVCKALNEQGLPCGARPNVDSDLCFWHDPKTEREAADARRLGGANHNKRKALRHIYDVLGLGSPNEIRGVLDHALDVELGLEASHNKARVLTQIASAALKLYETTELSNEVAELKAVIKPREEQDKKKRWFGR